MLKQNGLNKVQQGKVCLTFAIKIQSLLIFATLDFPSSQNYMLTEIDSVSTFGVINLMKQWIDVHFT